MAARASPSSDRCSTSLVGLKLGGRLRQFFQSGWDVLFSPACLRIKGSVLRRTSLHGLRRPHPWQRTPILGIGALAVANKCLDGFQRSPRLALRSAPPEVRRKLFGGANDFLVARRLFGGVLANDSAFDRPAHSSTPR